LRGAEPFDCDEGSVGFLAAVTVRVHDLDMRSRVHPKYKTTYRVGNWPAYERALVQRGDGTLWLSADVAAA
jgi:hypothetical protein